MSTRFEKRVLKLEQLKKVRNRRYAVHVSDPPTQEELAEIKQAGIEGQKIAVLPHKAKSVDEWLKSVSHKLE